MRKSLLVGLLTGATLLGGAVGAFASSSIGLVVNGKAVTNVEPMLINNTTYVPLRAVAEMLGTSVDWDGNTNTVYIGNKPAPVSSGVVSKVQFDQLKNGMTYDQVKEIIGFDGKVQSETGSPGDQYHTVMYEYKGNSEYSTVTLMFQDEKLSMKSQVGLE